MDRKLIEFMKGFLILPTALAITCLIAVASAKYPIVLFSLLGSVVLTMSVSLGLEFSKDVENEDS